MVIDMEEILMRVIVIVTFGLFIFAIGSLIRSIYELLKTLQSINEIKKIEYKLRDLINENELDPEVFNSKLDELLEELNQID